MNSKHKNLLERLENDIVLVAEGYVFELERRGYLKAGPFVPEASTSFPISLEPFLLTRYDMAEYATRARDMGIGYIGICCGAGPHHVRAMAEALGRRTRASKYSPDMSLHPVFGDKDTKEKHVECLLGPVDE